jgi:L-rhamnose isomerase/sugar isomerase
VHSLTGVCPTVALHVLWDLPQGVASINEVKQAAARYGVRPGSINPNVFQDQIYKHGSLGNPDAAARKAALKHILESVEIAKGLGSRDISLWFADGSNYPGTANIRQRKRWFGEGLATAHGRLEGEQRLLVEYKPFEPAFYHTDIADWGMALELAREAGPQAKVLVDTGHHYQAQNIEQIVAWLLDLDMLGGFHFNDRRYADDDLTMGSIDPYQVFRIFHEIRFFAWETGKTPDIAYMIDQSHNLKGKIEAMIQTVTTAQELFAKAALVDHEALAAAQAKAELVDAETCLKDAFSTDVRPAIREWAKSKGLPEDPMRAFRESGYLERITGERAARNASAVSSYA